MGLTTNQIGLIKAVAENNFKSAREYAKVCCLEDKTQKNAYLVEKYAKLLDNDVQQIEVPYNLKGMVIMEDVSKFNEERYYLSKDASILYDKIFNMNKVSVKLSELNIPYLNATLLTGESGTGKTTFGRYVAYKMNLPFAYINFSYLVDSYMGNTSKNLRNVFDFARSQDCVLMLDEIDCIARARTDDGSSSSKEFSNTTISLLQELDKIGNNSIIIGATNISSMLDTAVARRFKTFEFKRFGNEEVYLMIKQYLDTLPYKYDDNNVREYANTTNLPQAHIINHIIESLTMAITNNEEQIML